jgi:DNA uptake protein ComE-like DNA-binding protein
MKSVRIIALAFCLALLAGPGPLHLQAQTGAAKTGKTADKAKADKSASASAELIDINRASAAELRTLPGIGDAYSNAIIKHRPYKNKTQLRSQGVIPLSAYEKIKDKIIAKQ